MPTFSKLCASFLVFIFTALLAHAQAQQVLYSAINATPTNGWCVDNTEHNVAVKLTVPAGSSFDLALARVPFEYALFDPPSSISVDIFRWTSDSSPPSDPADLVATLNLNETLPSPDPNEGDQVRYLYTFSPPSPVRLQDGLSYWVQFNVTANSCAVSMVGSTVAPTVTQLARGAEYQNWGRIWTDRSADMFTQLELLGELADNATVPVPATGFLALVLGSLVIAGLAVFSSRRGLRV